MCNIAILDNVLMLDKNLELSEKLKKDFKEFNDILSLHLKSTKFDLGTESFLITLLEQKEKNYWFINSHLM